MGVNEMSKYKQYKITSIVLENGDGVSSSHVYTTQPFDEHSYLLDLDQEKKVTRVIDYKAYEVTSRKLKHTQRSVEQAIATLKKGLKDFNAETDNLATYRAGKMAILELQKSLLKLEGGSFEVCRLYE